MHVAAAGELLLGGNPERAGHPQVPPLPHQLRQHRGRRRPQRRYPRSRAGRRLGGQRPAPPHLAGELAEIAAHRGVGLQLLPLQLGGELRLLRLAGGAQRRFCHREGLAGAGLDQQQFFFHTHGAHRHCPGMPASRRPNRSRLRTASAVRRGPALAAARSRASWCARRRGSDAPAPAPRRYPACG